MTQGQIVRPPPLPVDEAALLAAMPPVARELAEAIGFAQTIELLCHRKLGGKRVFVPSRLSDDSPLVAKVGLEAAQMLHAGLGSGIGRIVDLPMLASVDRLLRNNAIRADFDAGASEETLAERYGLTSRHVRKVLNAAASTAPRRAPQPPRDSRTYDLFLALYPATTGAPTP